MKGIRLAHREARLKPSIDRIISRCADPWCRVGVGVGEEGFSARRVCPTCILSLESNSGSVGSDQGGNYIGRKNVEADNDGRDKIIERVGVADDKGAASAVEEITVERSSPAVRLQFNLAGERAVD